MSFQSGSWFALPSWFEEEYLYRIEEGVKGDWPSSIAAVRKDGKDFEDLRIARLRIRLESSLLPKSIYRLFFEADEFRRFIRIYVDSVQNKRVGKNDVDVQFIVPPDEIAKRLQRPEMKAPMETKPEEFNSAVEVEQSTSENGAAKSPVVLTVQ